MEILRVLFIVLQFRNHSRNGQGSHVDAGAQAVEQGHESEVRRGSDIKKHRISLNGGFVTREAS